jgi:hypothetical protein
MKTTSKILLTLIWVFLAGIVITAIVLLILVARDATSNATVISQDEFQTETPIATTPTPYAFVNKTIQLAWFYRAPNDGGLEVLAETFDSFILTKHDYESRDQLKEMGVRVPFLQYFLVDTIHDPGPGDCEEKPYRNQVAYEIGDFCNISENNLGWFLLDSAGNRIDTQNSSQRYVRMDPGDPGWQAFWLGRAREGVEILGWDGTFLDNIEASVSKFDKGGLLLQKYPTEEAYIGAVESFLKFIYTNYYQPRGIPLYANIISVRDPEVWLRYLQFLDGAMIEAWAVDWKDDYISVNRWEEQMDMAEAAQFKGKNLILVSQGDQGDLQRQEFAFASYLLINHGLASFRYTNYRGAYVESWWYANYAIDIGIPTGLRYRDGDVWRRDFTNGVLMVDPKNHSVEININE